MRTLITQITDCIEQGIEKIGSVGGSRIIVYPYGDVGIQVVELMRSVYDIDPAYIIDNHKCKYNTKIKTIDFLKTINIDNYYLILASTNEEIYFELWNNALQCCDENRIIELECMHKVRSERPLSLFRTKIGKYSYGPICINHPLIEEIGAFCGFAIGVDYVINHEMNYITTHPMICWGRRIEGFNMPYEAIRSADWYFSGVTPQPVCKQYKRAKIGNDVWLGRNVIVTNFANIGNGVIAAAGAVITKDVPDYAVVSGIPARVIRYRYNEEQIDELNRIKWWDWSDNLIRERYDDFYLPIDEFINKYKG